MFTLRIKFPLTGGNILVYKKRYMELGMAYKPNSVFSTVVSFLVISHKSRIGK